MFITKKRMQEKINEAIEKERERQWQQDRIDRSEREIYREIENLYKRINILEERLHMNQVSCEKTCGAVNPAIR